MSRTLFHNRLLLTLAALSVLSATTGCQGFTDPSPMPRGYVFHSNLYKTIPDSEPDSIGIPYTLSGTARAAASWRVAARDLTSRMAAKGALDGGAIFIAPQPPEGPFPAAFDHALRGALLERGYVLANAPGQGRVLTYRIEKVADLPPSPPPEARTESPPSPVSDANIVKVEIVPPSAEGAPMPLDLPPEAAPPAHSPAPSASVSVPETSAPVTDGLKLTIMTVAPGEKAQKPQILAAESGVYVIPGADYYDWNTPLIDWRPVTWGMR